MNQQQIDALLSPRPLVSWWAQQMERVLRRNDFKRGWEQMRHWAIHKRLVLELEELTQALAGTSDANLIDELVDISNYCAFMAWNLTHSEVRSRPHESNWNV